MIHGYRCGANTFPLQCRYCGERIFFFSCDCGSRVLFDELGPPWPEHNCLQPRPNSDASPSTIPSISGIAWHRGAPANSRLLPGFRRSSDSIDPVLLRRRQEVSSQTRDTVRMDPLGSEPAVVVGVIREISYPDLSQRYKLSRSSIGFIELTKQLRHNAPAQITIWVDDLCNDPSAIDYLSYTFLCDPASITRKYVQRALVQVNLVQVSAIGVQPFWLAKSIESLV